MEQATTIQLHLPQLISISRADSQQKRTATRGVRLLSFAPDYHVHETRCGVEPTSRAKNGATTSPGHGDHDDEPGMAVAGSRRRFTGQLPVTGQGAPRGGAPQRNDRRGVNISTPSAVRQEEKQYLAHATEVPAPSTTICCGMGYQRSVRPRLVGDQGIRWRAPARRRCKVKVIGEMVQRNDDIAS